MHRTPISIDDFAAITLASPLISSQFYADLFCGTNDGTTTDRVTYNHERESWVARVDWYDETGRRRCRKKQIKTKTDGKNLVRKSSKTGNIGFSPTLTL